MLIGAAEALLFPIALESLVETHGDQSLPQPIYQALVGIVVGVVVAATTAFELRLMKRCEQRGVVVSLVTSWALGFAIFLAMWAASVQVVYVAGAAKGGSIAGGLHALSSFADGFGRHQAVEGSKAFVVGVLPFALLFMARLRGARFWTQATVVVCSTLAASFFTAQWIYQSFSIYGDPPTFALTGETLLKAFMLALLLPPVSLVADLVAIRGAIAKDGIA